MWETYTSIKSCWMTQLYCYNLIIVWGYNSTITMNNRKRELLLRVFCLSVTCWVFLYRLPQQLTLLTILDADNPDHLFILTKVISCYQFAEIISIIWTICPVFVLSNISLIYNYKVRNILNFVIIQYGGSDNFVIDAPSQNFQLMINHKLDPMWPVAWGRTYIIAIFPRISD